MTIDQLLSFATFAFVAAATPGPNNVILTATGGAVGVVRGLPTLLGIISGFAAMIFLVAVGLGGLILSRPEILTVLRYVGILFLLWLSWQIASAPVSGDAAEVDSIEDETNGALPPTRAVGFVGGALFQWVNPKAWLVIASAIAAFLNANETAVSQAALFAIVFFVVSFMGCFPWLAFGAAIRRWLTTPRSARIFNVTMGLILAASIVVFVT